MPTVVFGLYRNITERKDSGERFVVVVLDLAIKGGMGGKIL